MTMPNFLVIGAAKAGTTSLYAYLCQHPQVYMSPLKETNFFSLEGQRVHFRGVGDHDTINTLSITTLTDYRAQFEAAADGIAIGEASPLYLYCPRAPERIRHYIPDAKLIAVLRHPVERAYSAFLHLVRDGREPLTDFVQAIEAEACRIHNHWEHIWHYTRMGFYYAQMKRYYDLFDYCQVRVYLYEDFKNNPHAVLRNLFCFLDVDETYIPDISIMHNVSSLPPTRKSQLSMDVRERLIDLYREDIFKLQDLIQRDLSTWLA
jgi:hypothetical protein